MTAQLEGDHVLVRDQAAANRIHNKGRFGKPLSGGALRLSLIEAAYLSEVGRLDVQADGSRLAWAELLVEAGRRQRGFEIHYLVYRDLRNRGYLLQTAPAGPERAGAHFLAWARGAEPPTSPEAWARAVSERSDLGLPELQRFVDAAERAKARPRLALVDEESDLTYYELATEPPTGPVHPAPASSPGDAVLLADRVLVTDAAASESLHRREFFGKPVGDCLQVSLVEAVHLVDRGDLRVLETPAGKALSSLALRQRARRVEPQLDLRLRAYEDLKGRGLIVKTGFKFGTHFRAYESQPDEAHAPYLVQAVPHDYTTAWEPLARAIRLSHSVRKRFYLAAVHGNDVRYVAFGRFRP